jgi:hypothetical protein
MPVLEATARLMRSRKVVRIQAIESFKREQVSTPSSRSRPAFALISLLFSFLPAGSSKNAIKDASNTTKRKQPAERFLASPGSEDEDATPPPTKKKRVTAPKLYVPKARSGGYAILLALLSNLPGQYQYPLAPAPSHFSVNEVTVFDDNQEDQLTIALQAAQLTKQEVINAGRSHSDADFEKSEKGGHYTAWSSMKTLIGRALVSTRGNPARYWLTKEGWTSGLAVRKAAGIIAQGVPRPMVQDPDPPLLPRPATTLERTASRDREVLDLPITPVTKQRSGRGPVDTERGFPEVPKFTAPASLRFSYIGKSENENATKGSNASLLYNQVQPVPQYNV